ncbi:antitoxin [Streptomyces hirsutus]|uniref:Antitoxin n=1 Tax=Streptomyces hirsutus TaxID=35620 RepID=A0ABZ1GLK7_9ACTN|nr:antitoxin [Streptomyces hirsutus]WSD07051.1 antitoxin [Streptomyces hirsutus]WTD19535.1 antitoxin [Streptomyces hirsutus]WTD75564.1 antitoxin [Streptomyces sp. NBC_01635]
MGIFDKFKSSRAAQDKAKKASDAAEKKINERTGGKYEDQIDAGQRQAEERLGMSRDQGRDQDRPGQT